MSCTLDNDLLMLQNLKQWQFYFKKNNSIYSQSLQ